MTQNNYSLEVISHHPTFKNKSLRKYHVDGIDTVGAWGDEPFEIKFTNHTWQKVQVKISLDGTDILSGKLASTEIDNSMWVVNGYGTMTLKAWPENNNGGAQFVFTSANNSVAVHTHGDLSARGIIAVAVFVEGHVEPVRLGPQPIIINNPPYYQPSQRREYYWESTPVWGSHTSDSISYSSGSGMSTNCLRSVQSTCSLNNNTLGAEQPYPASDLENLVSVGAGQHVEQKINYVQGLIKPILTETVRVRYLWWDDLVAKLRENNVPAPHASGFPGDKNQKNIDLGGVPKIGGYQQKAFPRERFVPTYSRV